MEHHLRSRHVDFIRVSPNYDNEERSATFLLWNLSGQLVGYQRYMPDRDKTRNNDPTQNRYFTRMCRPNVWGVEYLNLSPDLVFVSEGIFDAIRFINRGYSAIAILSGDPSPQIRTWIRMLGRTLIVAGDNDNVAVSGKKLLNLSKKNVTPIDSHDFGDASEQEIDISLDTFNLPHFNNYVK